MRIVARTGLLRLPTGGTGDRECAKAGPSARCGGTGVGTGGVPEGRLIEGEYRVTGVGKPRDPPQVGKLEVGDSLDLRKREFESRGTVREWMMEGVPTVVGPRVDPHGVAQGEVPEAFVEGDHPIPGSDKNASESLLSVPQLSGRLV